MALRKFSEWSEFKETNANQMAPSGNTTIAGQQAEPAGSKPLGNVSAPQVGAQEQELAKLASNVESKYQNFLGALPKSMPKAMWVNLLHNFSTISKQMGKLTDDEIKKIVMGQHSVTKQMMSKNQSEPQVGGASAGTQQVGNQTQVGQ